MTAGQDKLWNPTEHYKNLDVAENYDRQRFSSVAGRVYNLLEKRLIRRAFARLPTSSIIGDVPCGTGRLAEVLLECGFRVVGIDISPQMLDVASTRLERFGEKFCTRVLNANQLAASGMEFDAALCARVLMHFPLAEQIAFLRNLAAVTRGQVVFTQGLNTPFGRVRRFVKRLLGHQAPAAYPLSRAELRCLVKAAGLRERGRHLILPLISEAVVVVTEPITRLES